MKKKWGLAKYRQHLFWSEFSTIIKSFEKVLKCSWKIMGMFFWMAPTSSVLSFLLFILFPSGKHNCLHAKSKHKSGKVLSKSTFWWRINEDWLNIVSTCSEVSLVQLLRVSKRFWNALERLWECSFEWLRQVLYFRFSYLYFFPAGNIIVYTPSQSINREKYCQKV